MTRNEKTGEEEDTTIMSGVYLIREFTNPELRLLIDSLLFSRHLPYRQCRELVRKLETLSNKSAPLTRACSTAAVNFFFAWS